MKILGALIIIFTCWVLGIDFYKSNIKKLEFAKGLLNGIEYLKSEIVYSCGFLDECILKSASFSGIASEFMKAVGEELAKKGVSAKNAIEKLTPMLLKNTNTETYYITRDLFLQLGEKDCENQEKMLNGYLDKLSAIINKQNDFCNKECVMLKKTGIVAGVGIAVLLI